MQEIYLDNNSTTIPCAYSKTLLNDWYNKCSNASANNVSGQAGSKLIEEVKKYVNRICSLNDEYYVIFTSGASESNCMIIRMVIDAWHKQIETIPNIVTSAIEHKSIIECLKQLEGEGRISITWVYPNLYGVINPIDVEKAIKNNTALVTIMFANNEIGSINPIKKIGEIAHNKNVPFHTDAVQMFGKLHINIPAFNIDALSMSFHKLYGPKGSGMLIINKKFVEDGKLCGLIAGTQQDSLRGGTENIPYIAASVGAMHQNFTDRQKKNEHLKKLKDLFLELIGKKYPIINYAKFKRTGKGKAFCIFGPDDKNGCLMNTLLLSVIDYDKQFCNVKFKKELEENGIIVSIGSACNTKSKNASHVIMSLKAPPIVRRGILRISFGDSNTEQEINKVAKIFLDIIG